MKKIKKIMDLKFKKGIQKKLNWLFSDEEYHVYTLGELLKILTSNAIFMSLFITISFMN